MHIVCCLFFKSRGILDSNNAIVTYDRYTECGLDVRANAISLWCFILFFIFAKHYFPASQGHYARRFVRLNDHRIA